MSTIHPSFGFRSCNFDHSLFVFKMEIGIVILIVYVNDIIVFGSNVTSIEEVKDYSENTFQTKDPR